MNQAFLWRQCLRYLDTAKEYTENPETFIRFFDVTINGKLRHLLTYEANEKGRRLRWLHTSFAKYLQSRYRHSGAAYAYVKGKSFLDCTKQHLQGEFFLKTDIHAFFDSITCENMLKRISMLRIPKEDLEMVSLVTRACFYNGRLPLGFTSSPTLSDLYLVSLDRKFKKLPDITYTRYADDFIISASGSDAKKALVDARTRLEEELEPLGLELNRKKTYFRQLKAPGDAIHVLGVNIVRTETGPNRITVSDRYIRESCMHLCDWLRTPLDARDPDMFPRVFGRIAFIHQVSSGSFAKLRKMTEIKSGYAGPMTSEALMQAYIRQ